MSHKNSNSISGYYGVVRHSINRWQAKLFLRRGVMKYLGNFNTAIEAAEAYDKEAKKHGKKKINFPD